MSLANWFSSQLSSDKSNLTWQHEESSDTSTELKRLELDFET